MTKTIHIIGGGLAGSEAAWQIARRGIPCVLHEMRPVRPTPAHQTDRLAELVCSNSLKSDQNPPRPGCSKRNCAASIRCSHARAAEGPRSRRPRPHRRSRRLRRGSHARHRSRAAHRTPPRRSRPHSPDDAIVIVATGPLTSDALAAEIAPPHRLRPPLLLRQHQPHRRCRHRRHLHRLPGLALRQIARRHRRLPQLPVRPRRSTSASSTPCSPPQSVSAHIPEDDTPLLRSLPAHRRDRPPRPRYPALRPHEAHGPRPIRAPAAVPGPSCSCARRICAPIATTWSASRTT